MNKTLSVGNMVKKLNKKQNLKITQFFECNVVNTGFLEAAKLNTLMITTYQKIRTSNYFVIITYFVITNTKIIFFYKIL